MNEIPGDGDSVEEARHQIVRTTRRAASLQVALLTLVGLAVVMSSVTAAVVALGNRQANQRIRDCSEPEGRCYQQTQKVTAAAVQSILDYVDAAMKPHRLRNEAENECQVELFAGDPSYAAKGVSAALDFYTKCVLQRSGNTAPPPPPPNPLTSTTTR